MIVEEDDVHSGVGRVERKKGARKDGERQMEGQREGWGKRVSG